MKANVLKISKKPSSTNNVNLESNYELFRDRYSNWVGNMRNSVGTVSGLQQKQNLNSSKKKILLKKKDPYAISLKNLNRSLHTRKNSSKYVNCSIDRNGVEWNTGQMITQYVKREIKDLEEQQLIERETFHDSEKVKNDLLTNLCKFNNENDKNEIFLRKIYDKKLILDLKLVKDAHTEHLEKLKCRTESNAPNIIYLKDKIYKTKKKILFVKGIVDYAFPRILVEKSKSVEKLEKQKTETNLVKHKDHSEKRLTKSHSNNLKAVIGKEKVRNFNTTHSLNIFRNTFTFSKSKKNGKIFQKSPEKFVKVFSPIRITSFSPVTTK
jgi:hypothetical protein